MGMLILTRRVRGTICIGDHVRVTVLSIQGDQVRLGVGAPGDVSVDREEIWIRKKREKEQLAGLSGTDTAPREGSQTLSPTSGPKS